MATTNLGRVGLVPKGAYDKNATYTRLDLVYAEDGRAYVAVADSVGAD